MAWIESHQAVGTHPKTKKLARLLDISLPAAVGHLHYLWWWALDFAPSGSLVKFDEFDIADAVLWDKDPKDLIKALVKSGYIDSGPNGELHIHDWGEYAGKLLEKRAKDRARKRSAAEAAGVPTDFQWNDDGKEEEAAGGSEESQVTNQPTNQPIPTNLNQPIPTNSNQPQESGIGKPIPPPSPCPYTRIMNLFNTICVSFPRIRSIEGRRKQAVAARWRQFGTVEVFEELFRAAEASDFLRGHNDRNWSATFDWLINVNNMAKVLEGNYAPPPGEASGPRQSDSVLSILHQLHEREGDAS